MSGALTPSYETKKSRRYLCVYFPEWSTDVTRRKLLSRTPPYNPSAIVLTTTYAGQVIVARACAMARSAGVKSEMALQLAKALSSDRQLYYEDFDPIRDVEALRTLGVWFLRFSPHVGLDVELHNGYKRNEVKEISSLHFGIVLDLTGTERLHRNLESLAEKILSLFKNRARVALAPTIGGAWALSRFAKSALSTAPSIAALYDATSDLPVQALRINTATCLGLHEIGIHAIGQLQELPRPLVAQKFGKPLLLRLSQLMGSIEERFYSLHPHKRYLQRKIFEPPLLHKKAIALAIERLFNALIQELHEAKVAATLFSLALTDTTHNVNYKEVPLASATNDSRHLLSILTPIIDSMRFCGELREIRLEALHTVTIQSEQNSFTSSRDHSNPRALAQAHSELLNTFSVRIGKERISYAQLTHSYIPEKAFAYTSALDSPTCAELFSMHHPHPAYGSLERPPVLFAHPEPITTIAMLPDRPPSQVRWRNTNLAIISGVGPERIAPEWWRGDLQRDVFSERDYFRIQDSSGRWLWVFRDAATQRWFVHGVWT